MYNFGVTELQFICAGMFFTAFAFGSQFWEATVVNALPSFLTKLLEKNFSSPYLTMWLNSQMKSSIVNGIILMFIIILIGAMRSNWKHIRTTKKEALSQFVPISVVIAMEYIWYRNSIFASYAGLIMTSFGLLVSLLTCKLIICSMTKMKYPIM